MTYQITINCNNAAFDDNPNPELARILRKLADRLDHFDSAIDLPLHDVNGNYVGKAEHTD